MISDYLSHMITSHFKDTYSSVRDRKLKHADEKSHLGHWAVLQFIIFAHHTFFVFLINFLLFYVHSVKLKSNHVIYPTNENNSVVVGDHCRQIN